MNQIRYMARVICAIAVVCGCACIAFGPLPFAAYSLLAVVCAVAVTDKED